jgi:hypothetical protein
MSRPKGSKNKAGAEVKAQMLACWERLGSLDAYVKWAKENRSEFYRHWAQLAPKEVTADVRVTSEVDLTDEQLADIATGCSEGIAATSESPPDASGVH